MDVRIVPLRFLQSTHGEFLHDDSLDVRSFYTHLKPRWWSTYYTKEAYISWFVADDELLVRNVTSAAEKCIVPMVHYREAPQHFDISKIGPGILVRDGSLTVNPNRPRPLQPT